MNSSRRDFLIKSSVLGLGMVAAPTLFSQGSWGKSIPAIAGGSPLFKNKEWPKWPVWDIETDEPRVLEALRSGVWSRAKLTTEFEEEWAGAVGVKRSLTVVNGTNALITTLANLGVGPGDEVIVPPYTFIATIMAVLQNGAMPVFADVEEDTFLIDPKRIEEKITARTKVIMPVHIAGLPADMGRILEIARKHKLAVVEDACQAHLATYGGKMVGSIGDVGCFSFQNSKNLPIGEGGAIVSDDDRFMDRCYSYHNLGLPYGSAVGTVSSGSLIVGTKVRLTEYQAAIGLAMLKRLDSQTSLRHRNAQYLTSLLKDVPGIYPARLYEEVDRGAYHIYPFRYVESEFGGLSRQQFIAALNAEGIPCSSGYGVITDLPYLQDAFGSAVFKHAYTPRQIDFAQYVIANRCPVNDKLCNEQAVWFMHNLLLGPKEDMELIAAAIRRVHQNIDLIKS